MSLLIDHSIYLFWILIYPVDAGRKTGSKAPNRRTTSPQYKNAPINLWQSARPPDSPKMKKIQPQSEADTV
ncbi:MAG: hypothetical protein IPO37_07200 [Saprospiraceae bacterium]|nr:hypothetical protein [Saprospiraceae bacterium]